MSMPIVRSPNVYVGYSSQGRDDVTLFDMCLRQSGSQSGFLMFFDDETAPFKIRVENSAFRDRAGKKVRLKFQMFVLDCSAF